MNVLSKLIAHVISIPARIKGVKFGRNSFIGPGYDFIFSRLKGIEFKNAVLVGKNAWLQICGNDPKARLIIDDGSNIGRNVVISVKKEIYIGKNCMVSYNVSFIDHDHLFTKVSSPMNSGL